MRRGMRRGADAQPRHEPNPGGIELVIAPWWNNDQFYAPTTTDFGGVPPTPTQKKTATKFQRTGGAETQPRPCLTPGGMEVAIPVAKNATVKNGHHHAPKPVASPGIDINHNSGER